MYSQFMMYGQKNIEFYRDWEANETHGTCIIHGYWLCDAWI